MSFAATVNPCPTCGVVPISPWGKYPWEDCLNGWEISCTNGKCERGLSVSSRTAIDQSEMDAESVIRRWNNPAEREWECTDKWSGAVEAVLKVVLEMAKKGVFKK